MQKLELNLTGPVVVTKERSVPSLIGDIIRVRYPDFREKWHTVCYWEGADVLVQFFPIAESAISPFFQVGDEAEIEDEGERLVQSIEQVVLNPCIISSLWLGTIAIYARGCVVWRYLLGKWHAFRS